MRRSLKSRKKSLKTCPCFSGTQAVLRVIPMELSGRHSDAHYRPYPTRPNIALKMFENNKNVIVYCLSNAMHRPNIGQSIKSPECPCVRAFNFS